MRVSQYNTNTVYPIQRTFDALQAFVLAEEVQEKTTTAPSFSRKFLKLESDVYGQFVGIDTVEARDITPGEKVEAFFGAGPYQLQSIVHYLLSEQFTANPEHRALLEKVRDKLIHKIDRHNQRWYRYYVKGFQLDTKVYQSRFTRQIELLTGTASKISIKTLDEDPYLRLCEIVERIYQKIIALVKILYSIKPKVQPQPSDGHCLYHCFSDRLDTLLKKPEYKQRLQDKGVPLPEQGTTYSISELRNLTADYLERCLPENRPTTPDKTSDVDHLTKLVDNDIEEHNRDKEDKYKAAVQTCASVAQMHISDVVGLNAIKNTAYAAKLQSFSQRIVSSSGDALAQSLGQIQRDAGVVRMQQHVQDILTRFGNSSKGSRAQTPARALKRKEKADLQLLLKSLEKKQIVGANKFQSLEKRYVNLTRAFSSPPLINSVRDVFQKLEHKIKTELQDAENLRKQKIGIREYCDLTRSFVDGKKGFWGSHPSMYALSRLFDLNVTVSSESPGRERTATRLTDVIPPLSTKDEIHLDLENRSHYNLVV